MKTLANHILIYDKDCPLCRTYTRLFVRYGFLDESGRQAYQDMNFTNTSIDTEIAKNKIALLNTHTQAVSYGIDALTKVLGNRFSFISFCMKFKPLYWLMSQLYSLVSYNRKIVIPVSCKELSSCNPSENWFWRSIFILVCCISVQLFLPLYLNKYFEGFYLNSFYFSETLLFFSQIIFQFIFCKVFKERNIYDYIGHLSFVSFMGANMLGIAYAILFLLRKINFHTEMPGMVVYGIVIAWMYLEHRRRIKIMEFHNALIWTWVLYRIVVYPLVFSW